MLVPSTEKDCFGYCLPRFAAILKAQRLRWRQEGWNERSCSIHCCQQHQNKFWTKPEETSCTRHTVQCVNTTPNPRIRHTPAHVIFLAWLKAWVIESTGIVASLRTVFLTSSTAFRTRARCCFLHTWAQHHCPHALQSDFLSDLLPDTHWCLFHTKVYPAQIHRMCLSVTWLKRTRLQVMSPRISLKRINLFWSNRCFPQAEYDADLWFRWEHCDSPSWIGIGWWSLHRCTYSKEKQVLTTSLSPCQRKPPCQVHLTSEKVQGNLPQCSHTQESRVKKHFPTEKSCLQDIDQFKEKTKLCSGSLIQKKLRDWFLKNKEIICSQKQSLKSWSKNVKLVSQHLYSWISTTISFSSLGIWTAQIVGVKNLEESRPDFTKNWRYEKKHFQILVSEISTTWKNCRELRKCEFTNFPGTNWERRATKRELTLQIQEL